MKLLFMVDGDGIVQVLKLGNRGDSLGNGDWPKACTVSLKRR